MAVTLRTIPQEVAWRVVLHVETVDLPVLARTSRTLQHEAEARLYNNVELYHGPRAHRVCQTIAGSQRIADHVRNFVLTSRQARDIRQQQAMAYEAAAAKEYWEAVRGAVARMRVLDFFQIVDSRFAHSWVLAPASKGQSAADSDVSTVFRRRIRDARLYLACDEDVLRFLEETDIQVLTVADVVEDAPLRPLAPHALPHLTTFEGPLIVAMQLSYANPPLLHLKAPVDTEEALSLLPVALPELGRMFCKLKSLSLVGMPEECVLGCLDAISRSCPQLRYLSTLPLPFDNANRTRFLQYLTRFPALRLLEVDIASWHPSPLANFQRIFATELRMAAPTLHYITFYMEHGDRWFWHWSMANAQQQQLRRHPRRVPPFIPTSDRSGAGGGAGGAGKVEEEEESAENDQAATYVGLEGWSFGRGHGLYPNQTSLWKTI